MHVLYIQRAKKTKRLYVYTKIQTLCKKQDNLRYVFIHKKPSTLRYAIFHEIFESSIYIYMQSMTLCVMWRFYIQKSRHFAKSKTIWVIFLNIQKRMKFCVTRFFIDLLKLAGIFINKKQCTLHYIFFCKKQCTFRYVFIYKNPDTLRHIFICKINALWVTFFISKIYRIVYSDI